MCYNLSPEDSQPGENRKPYENPYFESVQAYDTPLSFIGKKFVETLSSNTANRNGFVTRADLPKNHRVCFHNGAFTADYRIDRFNICLDKNDIVVKEYYG